MRLSEGAQSGRAPRPRGRPRVSRLNSLLRGPRPAPPIRQERDRRVQARLRRRRVPCQRGLVKSSRWTTRADITTSRSITCGAGARTGSECARCGRRRGSFCPQAATRAVSSTLAVMAGLRGKRQRRELAKALVGVLLVRECGSEGWVARGAGSPHHLRSGCWSAPKAEPTSARAESPWRAMSNPRSSRAGRAQAARPTACAGRPGGKEAKGRPSAICWTLDGKSFVAAAVKAVVARVCLAIVEAGARMRASLTAQC